MFIRVVLILCLGVLDLVLLGNIIWGTSGIMEYRALNRQYTELKEEIAALDRENKAISREIRLMQADSKYAEKMVRQRLHYLRDNELVYLFTKSGKEHGGSAANDGKN